MLSAHDEHRLRCVSFLRGTPLWRVIDDDAKVGEFLLATAHDVAAQVKRASAAQVSVEEWDRLIDGQLEPAMKLAELHPKTWAELFAALGLDLDVAKSVSYYEYKALCVEIGGADMTSVMDVLDKLNASKRVAEPSVPTG